MYALPCPCLAGRARAARGRLASDFALQPFGDDGGATNGGGEAFGFGPGMFLLPATDMGGSGIAPPVMVDPVIVPAGAAPDPAGEPFDPGTEGGGSYSPGGSGGAGAYVPPPVTTDPAGAGQVVAQGQPATGPTHGGAAGPEVAAAGAGEGMLGWILGAIISAALVSRLGR